MKKTINFPFKKNGQIDIINIYKNTPNKKKLKIDLKKTKEKGFGIFAKKFLFKGETIAYYKLLAFDLEKYDSSTNMVYSIALYDKDDEELDNLIGDIDKLSFPNPINNIPFWGPFANEPSGDQIENAEMDTNLKLNYKRRKRIIEGDYVIYKLVAKKLIKPGDEITWYYGKYYQRDYKINIDVDEYDEDIDEEYEYIDEDDNDDEYEYTEEYEYIVEDENEYEYIDKNNDKKLK